MVAVTPVRSGEPYGRLFASGRQGETANGRGKASRRGTSSAYANGRDLCDSWDI